MVAIFGTGLDKVIIAITIPIIPRCARVVRSSALAIREMPYVDAARSIGYSHARIILRHMVPNVAAPFLTKIGRASCRERVRQYVEISAVGRALNKKTEQQKYKVNVTTKSL